MNKTLLLLLGLSFSHIAYANDASIKKAVETAFGSKVDEVRKTPYPGLNEIRIGDDVIYTDDKVSYLFVGNLIDTKTQKNLTQERVNKLATIKFSDLPLDLAAKTVRGNGKRIIASFEDPNCGYCKKFAKELLTINDLTVYTFIIPILSPDSKDKAKALLCSADRSKAWNELMLNGTLPKAASAECNAPLDKLEQLRQKLRISGTPTIFLSNGQRIPGYVSATKLEEMLKHQEKTD